MREIPHLNINETELAELKSITEKVVGLYGGSPDGEIITALTDKKDNAEQFARMIGSGKNADCYITPQMIKELEKWLKEIGFLAFIEKRTFTNVSGATPLSVKSAFFHGRSSYNLYGLYLYAPVRRIEAN